MLNDLEGHITKLHGCLASAQNSHLAESLVSDIVYTCGENANQQSIDISLSIFFKREKNLLTFLRKSITKDELRASKLILLQFLCKFIEKAGKKILPHVVDIKETCKAIFNAEKYSDVRCCTFPIISKILEVSSGNSEFVNSLSINKLADEYFLGLQSSSKLTSSIKSNIMNILGQMCKYHPEVMNSYSDKCLRLFLNTLKAEMTTKTNKYDFTLIAGTLEGLKYFLFNFPQSARDGSKYSYEIFDYTRKALLTIENLDELNRYSMPRAALDLLAKHAHQFDEYIYEDYMDLFERVSNWTKHKNYDLKKLAYITLDSYYKELAEMLNKKAKTERSKCEKIFKIFFKKFLTNLSTPDKDFKETIIAIKGYGAFAGPCRQFVNNEQMKQMFVLIIDLCERTYFLNQQQSQFLLSASSTQDSNASSQSGGLANSSASSSSSSSSTMGMGSQIIEIFDEKIYQLPAFIESVAYVCSQIDEALPEGCINVLEKLTILAIDSYPKLIKRYNRQISVSIAHLFISIQLSKGSMYSDFISRIVYQCMIRIFSYKTNYAVSQEKQFEKLQMRIASGQNDNLVNEDDDDQPAKNLYNITSVDYVAFWSNLLNLCEFEELNAIGVHINDRKRLVTIIYDEFIETIIKILKKLDLTSAKLDAIANELDQSQSQQMNLSNASFSGENTAVSSNPTAGLRPYKPKDFEILINLVDFAKELLTKKYFDLFEKWIFKFSKEVIILSTKYPLISGFYKLNTLCMRIARKIGYFNNVGQSIRSMNDWICDKKTQDKDVNMDNSEDLDDNSFKIVEDEEDENKDIDNSNSFNGTFKTNDDDFNLKYEKVNCFFLYKKFIKEIFVRMKQYKDELLASCLEFLLSLPKELVVPNLDELFQALCLTLDIGINYLPLADSALNSLEYWLKTIKLDKLKPFYSIIMGKFDDYLQTNRNVGLDCLDEATSGVVVQEKILTLNIKSKNRGRRKLPVKLYEKNANTLDSDNDLYEQIKLRILKILGQLAGEMSHSLFETAQTEQIIAWDTVWHLKFYVPFVDIKPTIYFDRFLPRIVYLALSSTNRQTKVIACELLHAIVVFMIGKSVTDPTGGSSSSGSFQMNRIYNRIYPVLFRLACDVDHFARSLFHPFVMQIIHWFTGNRKYESLETIELLNCIMDSLVDEKDAALRDFSAQALKEFLKWSIKHTPLVKQDSQGASALGPVSVNAKSILKRIFSFLTHPSCSKRLGAALAWNSIYVIFREEESLVNRHIFELLYYLIESLALAEKDDKMFGTLEHTMNALDHVERIIKTKSDLLNQRHPERIKPIGWSEAVLEVAVRWLIRQCGRIETECRHKSMELAYKLAPSVTGIKDAKEYFQMRLKYDSEMYFIARFEGSADKNEIMKESLSNYKYLTDLGMEHSNHLANIHSWLNMLTAPLDCYSWVFGERLLTPSNIFSTNKSCIWQSLKYFIDNIANYDLIQVVKRVYYRDGNSSRQMIVFTPNELDEFRNDKCTVLVRIIDFLCTLLANYPSESIKCIPAEFWCDEFFTLIVGICLDPQSVGFNLNDFDVFNNLPMKTQHLLKIFTTNLSDTIQKKFRLICAKEMQEKQLIQILIDQQNQKDLNGGIKMNLDWLKLTQLINGYEQLNEFGIYSMPTNLNREIFKFLYNQTLTPDGSVEQQENIICVEAKRKLFNLCLNINHSSVKRGIESTDYLIEILDEYLFESTEKKQLVKIKFIYYKHEICLWIYKRHEQMINYIFNKLKINFRKCVSLFVGLVEHLTTDKQLRKSFGNKIANSIYDNWNQFHDYWQQGTQLENKILLVSLLTKLNLIELVSFTNPKSTAISEMFMGLLVDKQTALNFKCKLLDLLHLFVESPAPYLLKNYLNQFITQQFPLKSTEFVKGEDSYNDYVNAIRKLLLALELTTTLVNNSTTITSTLANNASAQSLAWQSSFDLLTIIVNILVREKEHICDEEIQNSLTRYLKRLDQAKQMHVINFYWENFKIQHENVKNEENDRKSNLFRKIIINFFQNCDKRVYIDFLSANVLYLMSTLDADIKATNQTSYDTFVDFNGYYNKKCAFEILDLAYKRLSKDEIYSQSSKICNQYELNKFGQVKDGKELTKEILRKCRKFLFHEDQKLVDLVELNKLDEFYFDLKREMHCLAYNCLVSLFVRTQTEPKLYLAFLFKDDPNKNEFLFEPLIDKRKKYRFNIEIDNTEERKIKFLALRNQFNEENSENLSASEIHYINSLNQTNATTIQPPGNDLPVSYMNTQNMYESSLSEELSAFDFTGVSNVKMSNTAMGSLGSTLAPTNNLSLSSLRQARKKTSFYLSSAVDNSTGSSDTIDELNAPIEVELDDLNSHESMGQLVELIQSLIKNKITPIYANGQQPSEMPLWMHFFHRKICDIYTHENVKLFLIRVILNTRHAFKPYAKFWFAPLIAFLVNSSMAKEDIMDYFTLELVALLISWKKNIILSGQLTPNSGSLTLSTQSSQSSQLSSQISQNLNENKLINKLFETLMARCYHDNRQILRNNLELLKIMTESWKEHITVPVSIINEYLTSRDQKKIITGIQLFGVVLSNNIENYEFKEENLTRYDFYKSLIACMNHDSKLVHAPSAEVTGMLLKQLESKKTPNDDLFDNVAKYLFEVLRKLNESLFITCVHRIQLNYPPISARFMSTLIFHLPTLYGEFKIMCAESILSSIKELEDPFFKTKTFTDMLEHRETALQLICLKMINELLPKQNEEDLVRLMPYICSFINHNHVSCRYQMLVILMSIFETYQFSFSSNAIANSQQHASTSNKIKQMTNEILLKALIDPDQAIRLMAQNFWIQKANMPSSTIERMVLIMEKMYSPQTELEYLSYSTNLLLEKTSKSPDYNHLIYENPLSECTFREYNLTADWRRRHEMMTPLFVDTMFSSMNGGSLSDQSFESLFSNNNPNNLRATQQQSLQFQPTQLTGSNKPDQANNSYNWLTQSSIDTLQASLMNSSLSVLDGTQSSLLFNASSSNKRAALMNIMLNKPNQSTDLQAAGNDDISRLRRRFIKDTITKQSRFFARKNTEKSYREEEYKRQLKMKRTSHVEKYRQYRIGDFPDIQIKFSELIAPMQALAQRDSQIAMILFDSLFASILSELTYLNDDESKQIITKIEQNLNSMLNSSELYNPNFIACVLEISLKHANSFRLDPSSISIACLSSLQQSLGIVLIEEYLVIDESKSEKKSRSEESDALNSSKAKRARYSAELEQLENDNESTLWIELAKLYRSMNDYDSIKGIFSRKANLTTEFTKKGFQFESNSDYYQARKVYDEALSIDWSTYDGKKPSELEKELWEESLLKCCNELTDWKEMSERTTGNGTSLNDLFDDSYSIENLFPYAFRSKLKIILQEDVNEQKKHQDLIKFINEVKPEMKPYLEQSFSKEMALINLHQKDYNAAKYYAQMAIQKFLIEWSSINKTIMRGRMSKLQSLQSIVELNEFLKFIDSNPTYNLNFGVFNKKVDNLIELWTNSMPNIYSDPPCTWDDVITNRCIYFEFIEDKYYRIQDSAQQAAIASTSLNASSMLMDTSVSFCNKSKLTGRNSPTMDDDEDDEKRQEFIKKNLMINKLEKTKIFMKIKFAQAAQYQGNHKLALNKLQQSKSILKSENENFADLKLTWMHIYLKTHLLRSKVLSNNPEDALNMFFGASALKESLKYDDDPEYFHNFALFEEKQIMHGNFTKHLIDSFLSIEAIGSIDSYLDKLRNDDKKSSQLINYAKLNGKIENVEHVICNLMKVGVESLNNIKNELNGSLELSKYCDHYLRLLENSNDENDAAAVSSYTSLSKIVMIKSEFPVLVVQQLLNAIRLNSYEARQRFPRLLQIVELYRDQTLSTFIRETENIPCWMFLGWLSQMTALLDKQEAKAVYNIIENISEEYPQAFVYPFKMSYESFKFDSKTSEQKSFVEKLQRKMNRVPLVNSFIVALQHLANPDLLCKDFLSELLSNAKNRESVLRIAKDMYFELIENDLSAESPSRPALEWGNIRKNFSKHFRDLFKSEFGANCEQLVKLSESELKEKLKKLNECAQQYTNSKQLHGGNLGDYSPWLKSFKRNLAKDIEIPGQYSGKSKPMPEYHIKIESFDERLLIMDSLRKPKCVTIRGNDQKEHRFLVKCGEDQRQDQRIETLFELVNDLLKSDSNCYQRNLSIRTYQVIPMTNKLALIEWIPETRPLKDIIMSARTEEELKEWENRSTNPDFIYNQFISDASSDIKKWEGFNLHDRFGLVYAVYSREYASDAFNKIQNLVPMDLLRRYVRSMSVSTEAYFVLRNQFIMSYAVASAVQYILGIGDRHLSNWMIDMNSGKAIGIDFGMAFGHATIHLPIPELMPFRLTRQILKLIAPLEHRGLFESSMLHTMRALRENNDLLMCILDVFIKEPSIDWIGNAMKIAKKNLNEEMQHNAGLQYAKSRLKCVKDKLDGINPCVITCNDLKNGTHKDSRYLKYFINVATGVNATLNDKSGSKVYLMERARLLEEKGDKYRLTIEEQVRCMIEQSIDPDVLSRTWNGWLPYI